MKPNDTLFRDTNICAKATAKGKVTINTKGTPREELRGDQEGAHKSW